MKNQNSLNWLTPCLLFSLISNAHAGSTLSAGVDHVCGIQEDDTLICWGANDHNQADPPSGTFSEIEVGFYFGCGLKTDSTIACWGRDTAGETSPPPGKFLQVAVGGNHVCALPDNGEPICWGANADSQSSPPPGPFQQLASGDAHSCGLKADGSAECWGNNSHEQSNVAAETFSYIAAGYKTSCGIKTDGAAICWGFATNSYGYLIQIDFALNGDPDGTAHQSIKEFSICGLKADSSLSCPTMSSVPSGVFSYVATGGHVARPCHDCGYYSPEYHYEFHSFACGIRENGIVACWGENRNDRATPPVGVKIKQPSDFTPPSDTGGYTQADLDKARNEGKAEGKKACQTNPTSCGIDINDEVAAVIGEDLSLHVGKAEYKTSEDTQVLWVDLNFFGQDDEGKLLWELADYGVVE